MPSCDEINTCRGLSRAVSSTRVECDGCKVVSTVDDGRGTRYSTEWLKVVTRRKKGKHDSCRGHYG